MRLGFPLLALSLLAAAPAFAWTGEVRDSGLRVAATPVTARWGEETLDATFSVECSPGDDGALSLVLVVEGIEAFADFPYLDFEGPDAPMNERELFRVAVGDDPAATLSQTGWFTTGTDFAFGHADFPPDDGPGAGILDAVIAGGAPLVVSILHPDDPTRAIVAEVPLDGAMPILTAASDGCR